MWRGQVHVRTADERDAGGQIVINLIIRPSITQRLPTAGQNAIILIAADNIAYNLILAGASGDIDACASITFAQVALHKGTRDAAQI